MDLNINNLKKSETGEEFKITCNYNLLADNETVKWTNTDITLIKPYGLSKVSRIDFRNFKGDLLPYTNLELPNLKFGVSLNSNTVNNATINSSGDSLYGDYLTYNRNNRFNNVFTIDKAWTYAEEEDNQLLYNIKEGVNMVNKRLQAMYPKAGTGHIFNITDNTPQIFTSDKKVFNNNAGSWPLLLPSDNNVKMYYPTSENSENLIHIGSNQWFPYIAAINYNKSLSFIWFERNNENSLYGSLDIYYNTEETPIWNYINASRWEDHTTNNNKFGINPKSPSFCFGTIPGKDCVVCSPLVTRFYNTGAYVAIFTSTHRYLLDFRNYCGDKGILYVQACYTDPDDPISFLMWVNYDIDNTVDGRMYRIGIFRVNMSELSTDVNNPTVITSANVVCETNEFRDGLYLTRSIADKFATCGKECYGIRKIMREGVAIGYMFDGVGYILNVGSNITDYKKYYGWKTENDYMYLWNGDKVLINTAPVDIVFNGGYTAIGSMPLSGPVYKLGATTGLLQNPTDTSFNWPSDSTVLNPEGVANALYASDIMILDLNGVADDNEIYLSHTANGKATSDSADFFKITEDGRIQTSQLVFDTKALAFNLHIWTEPYYFDIITPCNYYVSPTYSIIHPIFDLNYMWLNSHVINTLETLILLHYEYNNLTLSCRMFPNMDGIIFYINEDAFIDFKTMAVNNTIDGIKIHILGGDDALDRETLKRLYGKLTVSVDWVQ